MKKSKILNHVKDSWYKYVIEIFVIVIGILIAFNLDNWNNEKQLKKVEIQSLYGIHEGLERLKEEVSINTDDEFNITKSCRYIINNFDNNLGLNDSLKTAFTLAWFYTHLQPDYGPYEFLNNYNSNVVSNSSLREEILQLYGLDLKASVSESNIRGQYIQALKLNMGRWFKSLNSNSHNISVTEPWDYQSLQKDSVFRYHLNTQLNESLRWYRELRWLEDHIEDLMKKVSDEIKRLEK